MKKKSDHGKAQLKDILQKYEASGYCDYGKNLWRPPFPELRNDEETWSDFDLAIQWAYTDGWERARNKADENPKK